MGGCIGRNRGSGGINGSSDNDSRPNSGKVPPEPLAVCQ